MKNVLNNRVVLDIIHGNASPEKVLETALKNVIEATMIANRHNQSKAALALGLSRGCLRTKLKELFGTKYIA